MTDEDLAALDRAGFIATLRDVFEHSAWIAERAWHGAPYHSFATLYEAMVAALDAAGPDAAIALVRAHPDLAGKAALAGELTADSRSEQNASGLSALTQSELARFQALNAAYKGKFGFPFVMAIRKSDKAAILAAFTERLLNDQFDELACALEQIKTIARWRIEAIQAA